MYAGRIIADAEAFSTLPSLEDVFVSLLRSEGGGMAEGATQSGASASLRRETMKIIPGSDEVGGADGGPVLQRAARLAHEAGLSSLAAEAERIAERIAGGRFYVACVGQFKRGKSTLLNALIGEPLLPTGVVPVTSVVTIVRYGAERSARVRFATGTWESIALESLSAYVSEEQNPDNEKGVEAVEVFVPAKLLEAGMCLVDTPGVGSVFAGAARATRAFVPHIDAALVVLGADPPISGEELALVEEVAGQVETLIFVLGKADRLTESERHQATRFAARVLQERLGQPVDPILHVSAAERLTGNGPVRDWEVLVGHLSDLGRHAGAGQSGGGASDQPACQAAPERHRRAAWRTPAPHRGDRAAAPGPAAIDQWDGTGAGRPALSPHGRAGPREGEPDPGTGALSTARARRSVARAACRRRSAR